MHPLIGSEELEANTDNNEAYVLQLCSNHPVPLQSSTTANLGEVETSI